MRDRRPGNWGIRILGAWCVLNILPGIGSLIWIALGKHAPAFQMLFAPDEIARLEPRALATTDGLAVLANTMIVSYFSLLLWVLLGAPKKDGLGFAFLGVVILQIAGYVADHYMGSKNIAALHFSSIVIGLGFWLSRRHAQHA